ncbi:hypothetical protein GDO81_029625 [Engystomops pustulosus]|uniref:Uncharacterized protein n=1 Tax=Engystomops pustulosus TaxID=76066 RepID=A0AAV6ZJZ1_ENGPU|nr:hypothetical protein GDO81_029625 [Engystomops pustulosus]
MMIADNRLLLRFHLCKRDTGRDNHSRPPDGARPHPMMYYVQDTSGCNTCALTLGIAGCRPSIVTQKYVKNIQISLCSHWDVNIFFIKFMKNSFKKSSRRVICL